MTEAEFLASTDPARMLTHLTSAKGKWVDSWRPPSSRKLRLFAAACCRAVWHLLSDPRSRQAVEVAEQYADGQAADLDFALRQACHAWGSVRETPGERVAFTAWSVCATHILNELQGETFWHGLRDGGFPPDRQAALLREINGNPFRPVTLPKKCRCGQWDDAKDGSWPLRCKTCGGSMCPWLTPTVLALAQAAYSGDWDNLPVLADALEEADCTGADILDHCRGPGLHVKGCWVVDILLGKS